MPQIFGALAAAAAAAIALFVFFNRSPSPDIGVRGGVTLHAMLLRDEKTERVESGNLLHAGDRIQLHVEDPIGGHVAVVWADDRGHGALVQAPDTLGVMKPPELTLPDSFEISGEAGSEAIYVILCRDPPDIDRWPEQIAEKYSAGWTPPAGCRAGIFAWRVE